MARTKKDGGGDKAKKVMEKIQEVLAERPKTEDEIIAEMAAKGAMPKCHDPEGYVRRCLWRLKMIPDTRPVKRTKEVNERVLRRRSVDEPCVMVCHQKHGRYYYHIPDTKALHKAALWLLKERLEARWYADPGKKPKGPGFSREDVEKLPEALREEAKKKLDRHDGEVREWEQEQSTWSDLKNAIDMEDGGLAWEVLRDRSDYEYEQVILEPYVNAP